MLTGEADGVRKEPGDRALSGSFCISGSGHYEVDAVREDSYAGRLAGEAQRLPPPALAAAGGGQPGDPRLHLRDGAAAAILLILAFKLRQRRLRRRRRPRPPAWSP